MGEERGKSLSPSVVKILLTVAANEGEMEILTSFLGWFVRGTTQH